MLSNKVLQDMAPLDLQRRVNLIRQKWGVSCNLERLKRFYRQNHLTWRVSSITWKITDEELPGLNEERHQFALRLRQIKANGDPVVSAADVTPSDLNLTVL